MIEGRKEAMEWWNSMNLEDQFYKIIKYNSLILGDKTRRPNTLTGREVHIIYKEVQKDVSFMINRQ